MVLLTLVLGSRLHRLVHVAALAATGGSRSLRERPDGTAPNSPAWPGLLIVALDGIDRPLLYGMLRAGELPEMAELLGGDGEGRHGGCSSTSVRPA